jgi:predicted nucleotide-binding protein
VGAFHLAVRAPAPVTAAGDYWFAAAQLTTVLQVRVTKKVFIELGANGFAALVRQQFLVRPQEEPVWSQPRIAGSLFGGVGTTFP